MNYALPIHHAKCSKTIMKWGIRALIGVALFSSALIGFHFVARGTRLVRTAVDFRDHVRYLLENGGTIGEIPATEAFDSAYLQALFGGDPELLGKLRGIIAKGLADDPSLNLGEVAAMLVTYRKNVDNQIEDVVAHVFGGFALAQRKPGFHRDGYFRSQLDQNLWNTGNSLLAFLGRDIVIFADEGQAKIQQNMLESVLAGDILPIVDMLMDRPIHFAAVFPDPRRAVPAQMRPHIQAIIMRGHLAPYDGSYEMILLTPNSESASYVLSLLYDMQIAAQLTLQSRLGGYVQQTEWGARVPVWWAHEMAKTLQTATFEKSQNIVKMRVSFERVMVNATLKTIERLGRDFAQMRGSLDERLDPRLVDQRLKSNKPLHYWSDAHRWGPDWPIADPNNRRSPSQEDPVAPPISPGV